LAKLKESAVAEPRRIRRAGHEVWTDHRAIGALQILGRSWRPEDHDLVISIARHRPDSEAGGVARRILKRQGDSG
jgi:hypothetical protein